MTTQKIFDAYYDIINQELLVALGCTEPIAIAYAGAKARQTLGCLPTSVTVFGSGNIIKNTKSVVVPNTNGQKGIDTAVSAGVLFGNPDKKLQVLSDVTNEQKPQIAQFAKSGCVKVLPAKTDKVFYIEVIATNGNDTAKVVIEDSHTNLTLIEKNGKILLQNQSSTQQTTDKSNLYDLLTVKDIVNFADSADLTPIKNALENQIKLNSAISEEGLKGNWGANIGKILATSNDVDMQAIASAAAGSDARMSGCELPVVIVSGSGNQGMTASLPVITYAKHKNASHDLLLRALAVSNLVTIHQKRGIGKLSAYCGAVSAGVGCACGIAYLNGGGFDAIAHTAVNAVAISSGIICDGAKPSCAAKIATSIFSGLLGYKMYLSGQEFVSGEGLVTKGVDNTIANFGRLAKEGMRETDKEIIKMMTE